MQQLHDLLGFPSFSLIGHRKLDFQDTLITRELDFGEHSRRLGDFFPIPSIKHHEHIADTARVIAELISMDRDSGQDDYLDALTDPIEADDDKHIEIVESTPC